MVAGAVEENLCFIYEPPKRARMNDAVAVALILRAPFGWRLGKFASARIAAKLREGREGLSFDLFEFLSRARHGLIWIVCAAVTGLVKDDACAGLIHLLKMFINRINAAFSEHGKRGNQDIV